MNRLVTQQPTAAVNQSKNVCFVVILIAVGIGGMLRFGVAQQDWLWLDELHTAWSTNASLADVSHRANQGNQTPLFFWLVWSVVQLLGKSELSVRMVALISGIAVIVGTNPRTGGDQVLEGVDGEVILNAGIDARSSSVGCQG